MRASLPTRGLRSVIGMTDAIVRRACGVTEFETDREGLFRIELVRADRDMCLSDGSPIQCGDLLVELHLWNEQLEAVPPEGADFGWAVRFRRQTLSTLQRLAGHIRDQPGLDAVRAVRMQPSVASKRPVSLYDRILPRIGFDPVTTAPPQRAYLHGLADSFWLWLLTWAHSPRSLQGRRFSRVRREFWISRQRLLSLYLEGGNLPATADRRERSPTAAAPVDDSEPVAGRRAGYRG